VDANQIYVVNYDILAPPHWKAGTVAPKESWMVWLAKLNPRLIVADEAQYVKQTSAARTRAVRYLAKRTPRVLLLTGTPLANKPGDLFALLQIVNPALFPSKHEFLSRYTHMRKQWYGWVSKGAKNLDELHHIITDWPQACMIRRRKVDVLDQLPRVQISVIPIDVDLR
jgi:SWI/SNF-related matrix-associated actin-dependent regulator 1 of chromatin subfamily A